MTKLPSEDLARARAAETGGLNPPKMATTRGRPVEKRQRPDGSQEPDDGISKGAKTDLVGQLSNLAEQAEEKVASGAPIRVLDAKGETTVRPDDEKPLPIDQRPENEQQRVFEKVRAYLDRKLHGPLFYHALPERNKFFVGRVLTQNESLDVEIESQYGSQMSEGLLKRVMVGELSRAMFGWVPMNAPAFHVLRANADDPTKWPELKRCEFGETRDPYIVEEEVIPLYNAYAKWKIDVTPSQDEIRFYWGRAN